MKIKITFLGTGTSQGIPVINSTHPVCFSSDKRDKRLRSSILVEWNDSVVVVDCGPDFRYQMLRANVNKINAVLFTHEHSDHTAGLDDLRPFSFQMGSVPIYAKKRVLDNLTRRFDYIFTEKDKYPGAPSVEQIEIKNEKFKIENFYIEPVLIGHGKLPIFGFKFNNIAYLTDIKTVEEEEKKKLQNLDVLILSAIRHKPHHSHLSLEEALVLIDELNPKKAYITHISHHMGFHKEVEESLPENIYLAYDELVIED